MNDDNPYAAPQSSPQPPPLQYAHGDDRCWRDGAELLVRPGADLPRSCVKCGDPASEYRSRTFYWHSPWLYLLILLHMAVYLIVALIVRKPASHQVGLCARHQGQRRNFILMAWLSLVPLIGGFMFERGGMILLGVLLFLVMLFWGLLGMRVLKPKKITPELAVYAGVSPRLLASLPRYPHRRD
ncbi:MAG: hypothetical protein ACN6RG_08015 [Stenotrophomonas sp.]